LRGFVALLLVLCIGAGAVLEWVRAGHGRGPFLVDSRRVDWRRFGANDVPEPFKGAPTEGPLAERIADLRAMIARQRFWAAEMHKRNLRTFEPVHGRGAVIQVHETRMVVQISTRHPVNDQWNFCAQADGSEYFCRLERRAGNILYGVILEQTKLRATPQRGVLLLRPIPLRPPVYARTKPSRQELEQLTEHLAWLRHATDRFPTIGRRTLITEATVLETSGPVVVLSHGKRDGVTVGFEFKVSRRRQFVGFVRITRVLENSAVGEFDERFAGRGAPPRTGDRAYIR